MRCPLYSQLRDALFLYVENVYNNFGQMSENDKFNFLFSVYITRDIIKKFRAATSEYFDIAFVF